jgi:hypothetical protein
MSGPILAMLRPTSICWKQRTLIGYVPITWIRNTNLTPAFVLILALMV